jgi:hypothetical protein
LQTKKIENSKTRKVDWNVIIHGWLWHGEHMDNNVMSLKIWLMFNHRWVLCDGWFHPIHFEYGDNIKSSIQDYLSKWYFWLRFMLVCVLLIVVLSVICCLDKFRLGSLYLQFNLNTSYWWDETYQLIGIMVFIIFCGFVNYLCWWTSTVSLSQIWL